jgi:transposase
MDRSDRLKLRSAGSIARSIHWTPKNGTTLKNGRLVVWESSRAKNSRAAQPEANSQGEAARRSSRKGVWVGLFQALAQADGPPDQVLLDSSAVKAHRSAAGGKGGKNQAIGRSRGGRSTKIHALTDAQCRPLAFMLTGGQVADCTSGALLLEQLPDYDIQHADKGYDANAIRRQVEERGATPNIPPKANAIGRTVSRRSSTATATPSSACSAASRTSGASPHDTTEARPTSSQLSASLPRSATNYESGP